MTKQDALGNLHRWGPYVAAVACTLVGWGATWAGVRSDVVYLQGRVSALESKREDDSTWRRSVDNKLTAIWCKVDPPNCRPSGP